MKGWTEAAAAKRTPATPRKPRPAPTEPPAPREARDGPQNEPPVRPAPAAVYGVAAWPPPGWRPRPDTPAESYRFVCHGADEALRQALEATAAAHGARRQS